MKVAIIYNKDRENVINVFGMQNMETYNPKTVLDVAKSLEQGGHNVEIIDGNMNVIDNIKSFLPKVKDGDKFGLVFNMAYGIQGESRYTHIPAMLEMLGIPYVGSSPSGHVLALDKIITKVILQKNNIPTPNFWFFSSKYEDMSDVVFPVIVKPKMESVSFGLKVVYNIEELQEAVDFVVSEFKQQALVETFVRGREFAVGLIGNDPVEAFPVLEIDLEGDPDAIQTVDDKKEKPRNKICPANISDELAAKMKKLSIDSFKALGLRDFARVDIRLDENDNIYILEINSMASLGATGSYVAAAKTVGLDFTRLVNKMLDVAAMRYFTKEIANELPDGPNVKSKLSLKMRSYISSKREVNEAFLEEMVNINTYYRNIEGVNKLGTLIKKKMHNLGFYTEMFYETEVGNSLYFTNSNDKKCDYLIIGNLDSNVPLNKHSYYHANSHKYMGTGVWENKSGLAVLLLAIQSLKYSRLLSKIKVGILLTTDDALSNTFTKDIIKEKSNHSKYIFGIHGADINGGMVTSRAGSVFYNFEMNLKKANDHYDVVKCTNIMNKMINDWVKISNEEKGIIVAPKNVNIKSKISEPYFHGEVGLSVRFNYDCDFETIDAKLKKVVSMQKSNKMIDFHLERGNKRPAMEFTDSNQELLKTIKDISNQHDINLSGEHRWSSADISLVNNIKPMVDGFGGSGKKENEGQEYVLRHTIAEKALLLAMTMQKLNI